MDTPENGIGQAKIGNDRERFLTDLATNKKFGWLPSIWRHLAAKQHQLERFKCASMSRTQTQYELAQFCSGLSCQEAKLGSLLKLMEASLWQPLVRRVIKAFGGVGTIPLTPHLGGFTNSCMTHLFLSRPHRDFWQEFVERERSRNHFGRGACGKQEMADGTHFTARGRTCTLPKLTRLIERHLSSGPPKISGIPTPLGSWARPELD